MSEDRDAPGGAPGEPRVGRRWRFGAAVVLTIMALQAATDVTAGRDLMRVLARMGFLTLELPVLLFAFSKVFAFAVRHRVRAWRALLYGVATATVIGAIFGMAYGGLAQSVPPLLSTFPNGVSLPRAALFGALYAQLYAGLWALAFLYPSAVESARMRSLEAQKLRSEAELARLRGHLEPHFLLNTLNAIAGLVTEEPREARRLIVCLGELLRDAVRETSELQRLDDQMAWLRRYAAILETRHRGLLRFSWNVAPDAAEALLPRLLLQPLVENAVKHGALRRAGGAGQVDVTAEIRDGTLLCTVRDNGPGMREGDPAAGAFGLHAVRRRLELEAPTASLRFESSPEGTLSVVAMPGTRFSEVPASGPRPRREAFASQPGVSA